jgi:glycosyltransferase involved in cell wall biosynthesis
MNKSRIAMVVFSSYPWDPRVRREAEALEEKGYYIDIFCLKYKDQPKKEKYGNITVYRSSVTRSRSKKIIYILEYSLFILSMCFLVTLKSMIRRYGVIHVHNMPDVLIFIGLLPKIFGTRLILDLHDPTPEVYMSKYSIDKSHKTIRLLIGLERLSIKTANHVITPNKAFKDLFASRSCSDEKISIVMNSPNEKIFHYNGEQIKNKEKTKNKFSIIYHGSIVERHGLYDALIAVKNLRGKIPCIEFNIYGDGDYSKKFEEDIKKLCLNDIVFFYGPMPQENLVEKIVSSNLGIIPNRRDPFTEINLPTRIFEYLCFGKPVIAPHTKGISDYFNDDSLIFFDAGNAADLAKVIYEVYKKPERFTKIIKKGMEVYKKYTWDEQKKKLVSIYANLLNLKNN